MPTSMQYLVATLMGIMFYMSYALEGFTERNIIVYLRPLHPKGQVVVSRRYPTENICDERASWLPIKTNIQGVDDR